jgi:LacI family transcriptional regulator
MQDIMQEDEVLRILDRIAKRGSNGVLLKARDTGPIRQAVDRLAEAKIPVVTLVTDIATDTRLAYVGVDNSGAGRTAAYLLSHTLQNRTGAVLATRSHERFLGEEEREDAFKAALREANPRLKVVSLHGGRGVNRETSKLIEETQTDLTDLIAVYSMGGGNRSILTALEDKGVTPELFIAHDLDRENHGLLNERRIDFVLHHDLKVDISNAFKAFLSHLQLTTEQPHFTISTVNVITPANIPHRFSI